MANLREAFDYASKNPTSDFALNLEKLASSGSLDVDAKKYGIDLTPFKPKAPEAKPIGLGDKLLGRLDTAVSEATLKPSRDILNNTNRGAPDAELSGIEAVNRVAQAPLHIAGALGGAINDTLGAGLEATGLAKPLGEAAGGALNLVDILGKHVMSSMGIDTSKVPTNDQVVQAYNNLAPEQQKVIKSIVDSSGLLGIEALAKTPALASKVITPVRDFTVGTADKVAKGVKNISNPTDKISEIASSPEVHPFIASSPANAKLVADSVKQGFQPKEVKFLTTINKADKPAMKEMTDLAEKGMGDLRAQYAGKRPADVVGDWRQR